MKRKGNKLMMRFSKIIFLLTLTLIMALYFAQTQGKNAIKLNLRPGVLA